MVQIVNEFVMCDVKDDCHDEKDYVVRLHYVQTNHCLQHIWNKWEKILINQLATHLLFICISIFASTYPYCLLLMILWQLALSSKHFPRFFRNSEAFIRKILKKCFLVADSSYAAWTYDYIDIVRTITRLQINKYLLTNHKNILKLC